MHLELSTPIDQIQIKAPEVLVYGKCKVGTDRVVGSVIHNGNHEPITLRIHTTMAEHVHDAKNRAYIDVDLVDETCRELLSQLNAHVLGWVIQHHKSPEWFDKEIPKEAIVELFDTFEENQKTRKHPFLRLKTGYTSKQPSVTLLTAVDSSPGTEPTATTVSNLTELAGKAVCYEVQLGGILFEKQKFVTALNLVAVHHTYAAADVNFADLVLNNAVHRDKRETYEKVRVEMEKQRVELCQLELLKEEVEKEVATAMSKRDDLDRQYQVTMAQIQEMEEMHNVEGDVMLANEEDEEYYSDDYDEIIEPLEGMEDISMESLAAGTVTVVPDEEDEEPSDGTDLLAPATEGEGLEAVEGAPESTASVMEPGTGADTDTAVPVTTPSAPALSSA
jgi:hypothetical protein